MTRWQRSIRCHRHNYVELDDWASWSDKVACCVWTGRWVTLWFITAFNHSISCEPRSDWASTQTNEQSKRMSEKWEQSSIWTNKWLSTYVSIWEYSKTIVSWFLSIRFLSSILPCHLYQIFLLFSTSLLPVLWWVVSWKKHRKMHYRPARPKVHTLFTLISHLLPWISSINLWDKQSPRKKEENGGSFIKIGAAVQKLCNFPFDTSKIKWENHHFFVHF